jgi:two-component system sensor histidine kinase RegB
MFESLRRASRVVLIAGRLPMPRESADAWLIALRWLAIAGMLLTTWAAKELVPGLPLLPLTSLLTLLSLLNIGWMIFSSPGRSLAGPQLLCDVVALGALLWFSGGIENPFAGFLTFQIALAGLVTRGNTTAGIAGAVVIASLILFFAPEIPWHTAVVSPESLRRIGSVACVAGFGGFTGFAAWVHGRRLDALRAESTRDERLTMAGRLAGSMAHELNTPLATILLASNELAEIASTADHDEVIALSRTLAQQAQRASDIIELLRGRVRDGQLLSRMGMMNVSALVVEILDEELARLHFKGKKHVAVGDSIRAWGSAAALRQILMNVAKNAVEAMASSNDRHLEIAVTQSDQRVRVVVRDNGGGIPSARLARLGEPFQTSKELSGGMGLGLYVCATLAEQMGAQLLIESREGEETCVTLALRRDPPKGADAASPALDGLSERED